MASNKPSGVTLKKNDDGSDNPKYVDLLDEDKPISGQKFVCLSFITPEQIIKQKNMFFFEEFLKQWDFSKSMEKFLQFLNFVSFKYNVDFDKLSADFEEFAKTEKDNLIKFTIEDEYKTFMDNNEERLESDFSKKHEFQTNLRGLKVRGVFPNQSEAELRCKMLREVDPNHDVLVGPVGTWLPLDMEAYKTGRVEYMEETLNQLMSEKKKNEEKAKDEFEKRVKDAKEQAIKDNVEKAKDSGNKLTQTLNEDGDLVSVANMNTTEKNILESNKVVDMNTIKEELFEGENIIPEKNSDHGLSQLTQNQTSDSSGN